MQYVRSISGSVSKTWNSINPATLSGAIDVVVVEQEDGSLACSPFHIRFGKFSLLRPYEKKVEFKVNGEKMEFPMKLGEGGEAFFVFETRENVPAALQTSPLVSPATSPQLKSNLPTTPSLQELDPLDLNRSGTPLDATPPKKRGHARSTTEGLGISPSLRKTQSELGRLSPLTNSPPSESSKSPPSDELLSYADRALMPKLERSPSDSVLPAARAAIQNAVEISNPLPSAVSDSPASPLLSTQDGQQEAKVRAMSLSRKLWTSNISNQVTESGDLMLDMTGFKDGNAEALQAEGIARQLLSEEIDGPYDIGALIGADDKGNIWIYRSQEAKAAAAKKAVDGLGSYNPTAYASTDALSDPGYHSDDARSDTKAEFAHHRRDSDSALGTASPPSSPGAPTTAGDPNKNYAKTLRLTSDQLKTMNLQSGANSMAFTVNRATCNATLWYWKHDIPIVISDIDGTITKSDVMGHLMNSIGRDWTHLGVAKLYTDISANGYNFLYLTSRSVGLADTTRTYMDGVVQEGFKLPKGPVILSPDRTIAALRREVYLRKPEIFKMACLRDIMALFSGHGGVSPNHTSESVDHGLHVQISASAVPGAVGVGCGKAGSPFYAGFGNRLTDALSYRSVNIPSTRIFTINSNSEVSLDLLSLNKYKTAYSSMREIVDHYFPPVGLLVQGGGEDFTDFNYWRDKPLDIVDFTDSEDEADDPINRAVGRAGATRASLLSEDEAGDDMTDSYLSQPRRSLDETVSVSRRLEEELETEDESDDGDVEDELDEEEDEEEDLEDQAGYDAEEDLGLEPPGGVSERSAADRTPRVLAPAKRLVDSDMGLGIPTLDERTARKG